MKKAIELIDQDIETKLTTIELEKSDHIEKKILYPSDLQPIVTIKDIFEPFSPDSNILSREYFSHFIVRNEGRGPAIEIEIALLDNRHEWLDIQRETILRADESLEFRPTLHRPEGRYYILCQYKKVSSQDEDEIWAQTWLPFKLTKASREEEVYVSPGELEFKFGIHQKDKLEIFMNKPK